MLNRQVAEEESTGPSSTSLEVSSGSGCGVKGVLNDSDNLVRGRRDLSLGNYSDAGGRARERIPRRKVASTPRFDTDQASQFGSSKDG